MLDTPNPDQILIDTIIAGLKDAEVDLTLLAPVTTAHKMKDGRYKTTHLHGDETFTFAGIREGKRASYIFEFEPVDARDYVQVEFDDKRVFEVFPALREPVQKALNLDTPMTDFKAATTSFRNKIKREQAKIQKTAEKQERASAAERAKDDPLWGAWG